MCRERATCVRRHDCVRRHVSGYKLLVRDTMFPGDIVSWCKLTVHWSSFLHTTMTNVHFFNLTSVKRFPLSCGMTTVSRPGAVECEITTSAWEYSQLYFSSDYNEDRNARTSSLSIRSRLLHINGRFRSTRITIFRPFVQRVLHIVTELWKICSFTSYEPALTKSQLKLQGTRRVRTQAVTVTLTFEPKTMSLVWYPKVIPYTDPVTLTSEPQNSITSRVSQWHSLYQVWTLWDHSFLSYAADKQTDKQTGSKILPTPTDRVVVQKRTVVTAILRVV